MKAKWLACGKNSRESVRVNDLAVLDCESLSVPARLFLHHLHLEHLFSSLQWFRSSYTATGSWRRLNRSISITWNRVCAFIFSIPSSKEGGFFLAVSNPLAFYPHLLFIKIIGTYFHCLWVNFHIFCTF